MRTESVVEGRKSVEELVAVLTPAERTVSGVTAIPEPVWRSALRSDANIALAGLRIEIERRVRQLAEQAGILTTERFQSLSQLVGVLKAREVFSTVEANAVMSVVNICNQAVHAEKITPEAAAIAADLGDTVIRVLDSKLQKQ